MGDYGKNKGYQKKGSAIIGRSTSYNTPITQGNAIPIFETEHFNDSQSISRSSDTQIVLKAGKKYRLTAQIQGTTTNASDYVYLIFYNVTTSSAVGTYGVLLPTTWPSNHILDNEALAYVVADVDTTISLLTTQPASITAMVYTSYVEVQEAEAYLSETLGRTYFTENVGIGDPAPVTGLSVLKSIPGNWGISSNNTVASGGYGIVSSLADDGPTYSLATYSQAAGTFKFVVTGEGNVGIGTASPSSKLHIFDGTATNASSRMNLGVTGHNLVIQSAIGSSRYFAAPVAGTEILTTTASPISFGVNKAGGNLPDVTIVDGGNVGIGTPTPDATLEVNGYTKLGIDAPKVKMKRISGTTASTQGGTSSVAHGVTGSKIISFTLKLFIAGGVGIDANHSEAGYIAKIYHDVSQFTVGNTASSSINILSVPFQIVLWYEE